MKIIEGKMEEVFYTGYVFIHLELVVNSLLVPVEF